MNAVILAVVRAGIKPDYKMDSKYTTERDLWTGTTFLVREGIDSISLNPDSVMKITHSS